VLNKQVTDSLKLKVQVTASLRLVQRSYKNESQRSGDSFLYKKIREDCSILTYMK